MAASLFKQLSFCANDDSMNVLANTPSPPVPEYRGLNLSSVLRDGSAVRANHNLVVRTSFGDYAKYSSLSSRSSRSSRSGRSSHPWIAFVAFVAFVALLPLRAFKTSCQRE